MACLPSRLLTRSAAGILGGLALAAACTAGIWAGSWMTAGPWPPPRTVDAPPGSAEPREAMRPGRPTPTLAGVASVRTVFRTADDPEIGPVAGSNTSALASSPPQHHAQQAQVEEADDPVVFAALERLERWMAAGMRRARDSVVALEYSAADSPPGTRRLATGVVINTSGDVLSVRIDPPSPTAAPAAAAAILARDASGRRHAVQWMASDPETGLTLLRIPPETVPPIVMAGEGPFLGSQVFVVGNPLGLGHSVSRGHVAGLDRALMLGQRQVGGLIQVQAPLYPGDSGAVVTNLRGQLLGLIRSGLALPAGPNEHAGRDNDFGFAIGTRDLLWIADQLRARGRVDRAYLGVRLQPAALADAPGAGAAANDPRASERLDGAYLQDVLAGTPAAQAGLLSGDAIIAIDGEPIRSSPDLTDRLDRLAAHTTVRLDVLRGSGAARKQLRFELQTTSRPDFEQASRPTAALGTRPRVAASPVAITPTAAPVPAPALAPAPARVPAAGKGP